MARHTLHMRMGLQFHDETLHYITLSSFHTPFTPKVTSGASTKLRTTGRVCECKEMSFQLLFQKNRYR